MRILLLLLSVFLSLAPAKAQDEPEYRLEIGLGAGLVNYEGDFNGNIFGNLQPIGGIVARYVMNPYLDFKWTVSYGKLKGSSADVQTYYTDHADAPYTFNHSLWDTRVVYEYNFWPYGTGHDYRGSKRLTPFVFGGIGATYVTGGSAGNVFTANIPIGVGVKYKLAERLNVGLEWAIHFSLSDELDGVKDPYGIESTGIFKNTDCYSALMLTLTYSFRPRCITCNKDE